jgi:hypothetical protein
MHQEVLNFESDERLLGILTVPDGHNLTNQSY